MSVIIQFPPDLSGWIVESLEYGRTPAEIVQSLVERRLDPRMARTVVDAFVSARRDGRPVPVDSVMIETGAPDYVYEAPRLAIGPRRFAEVAGLPVENGEGLQILHYPVGAQFPPHFDFVQPSNKANEESIARSGQRVSTLIAYLNDVEDGGETAFPTAGWTVFPRQGSAVYFEYANSRGQVDPRTLHAGCPVLRGEKWIATKWMRERRFVPASACARGKPQ